MVVRIRKMKPANLQRRKKNSWQTVTRNKRSNRTYVEATKASNRVLTGANSFGLDFNLMLEIGLMLGPRFSIGCSTLQSSILGVLRSEFQLLQGSTVWILFVTFGKWGALIMRLNR